MDNLELYNKVRAVPEKAKKPITAGRLKGMTDINPMWRIKTLTEQFGACGKGWYVKPLSNTTYSAEGEIVYIAEINLYVRDPYTDEWLEPIYGIGGSKLVSKERNGLYVDDEAPKKANTDALSVACKNLGIGADVYWDSDNDKYVDKGKENFNKPASTSNSKPQRKASTGSALNGADGEQVAYWRAQIEAYGNAHGMTVEEICNDYGIGKQTGAAELEKVYNDLNSASTSKGKGEHDSEQTSIADNFAALDEKVPF